MKTRTDREALQREIVYDLSGKATYGGFHFSEIQTGTGKTKILLDVANKALAEGRSVIISTGNNFLALNFLEEAKKFGIDEERISFIVGKDHYLDRKIVTSDEFLFAFALDRERVEEWLTAHRGKELISLFIADFELHEEAEEYLSANRSEDERSIRTVSEYISERPAIYITNHYYLTILFKYAEARTLDKALVLCDEVHLINSVAKNIFKQSFSPFRLKYLLFDAVQSDTLPKTTKKVFRTAIDKTDALLSTLSVEVGETNTKSREQIQKAVSILNNYKKGVYELMLNAIKKLPKKKITSTVANIEREVYEIASIVAGHKSGKPVSVSFSPVRRNPTFSTYTSNPIGIIRSVISRHNFTFIGVSGTICVSPDTSVESNKWSFERLGFYKYAKTENPQEEMFNAKVENITLRVYPSIFLKEQARYYIAKEEKYKTPVSRNGEMASPAKYRKWIENIGDLCKETLWGNSVVLMSSFENIMALREVFEKNEVAQDYRVFYHTPAISMRKVIEAYKKSIDEGYKSLLIGGLGFYTGIDLHGDYLNTLFLGKLPIEPNTLMFTRFKIGRYSAMTDMRLNALLTFRQGIGRAIRTPDDRAFIVVADPRIKTAHYRVFEHFLQEYAVEIE